MQQNPVAWGPFAGWFAEDRAGWHVVTFVRRDACPLRRTGSLLGWLCLFWLAAAAAATAGVSHRATLYWKNGDQLPGDLLSADPTTIRWQSTLFRTPFSLSTDRLDKIQYVAPPTDSPTDSPSSASFRILTDNFDVLYGDLLELTQRHIVLRSPRHGSVRFDRAKIVAMQRTDRSSAGAVGLGLLSDWSTLHRGRRISEWTREGGGRIVTKVTGAELCRDLHLAALSDIEVSLSWEGKPGFVISFADPDAVRLSREVVKLETWDNDLVLQTLGANGDFEVIHNIPPNSQSIDLRLQWNPMAGELKVYTLTGQLLGKMQGKAADDEPLSGFYLQNKGLALALTRMRATGGHDADLGDRPPGTTCLHLDDASSVLGIIDAYDPTSRVLTMTQTKGGSVGISLDRIDSVDWGNQPQTAASPASTRFSFGDGTLISGTLESITDGVIRIQTTYCDEPVTARLDGISDIRFESTSAASAPRAQDMATIGEFRLRGQFTPVAAADQAPGWRPEGSANASLFAADLPVHIVCGTAETSAASAPTEFGDRVFLRNGDAVPCKIRGIDESSLLADFPLTDSKRIDRHLLIAAEFAASAPTVSRGLADPRWVVTEAAKQAVQRDDNQIVVSNAAVIGYANMRDAAEIKFDIEWELSATTMIQMQMFASSPKEISGNPTLMLYRTGGTQVFLQVMQGGLGNAQAVSPRQMLDGRNTFRIRTQNKKIFVYDGDTEVLAIPSSDLASSGKSLTLHITPLNVNGGVVAAADDNQKLVTISNVEVRHAGGDLQEILIEEDQKNRLLTVPRFGKLSPPTEILVGRNGDLLRGRLIALDQQRATFQSRLDQLEVARDRLAGIIWPLSTDAVPVDDAADQHLARIVLRDATIMRMTADRMASDALVGRHPSLGAISVPLPLIRELSLGLPVGGGVPLGDSQPDPFASWTLRGAEEPKFASAQNLADGSGLPARQGHQSPLVGHAAPPFTAELLDGTRVRVPDTDGKTVVLDFWASWCVPCVKTMPHTLRTVSSFPREKIVLLAVNQLETPDAIREFLQLREWEVPVALDRSGDIGKLFQVDSIPQLVVIGPDGTIQQVFVGDQPETQEQLKALLMQLTADKSERAVEAP